MMLIDELTQTACSLGSDALSMSYRIQDQPQIDSEFLTIAKHAGTHIVQFSL